MERLPLGVYAQAALLDLAANDGALNFGSSFPDAIDAQIPVQALHRVLTHITAASENLQRAVDHAASHLRAE